MTDKVPFEAALRRLIQDQERDLAEHPSVAELVAYHDGRLPRERLETLRDHVAICSACATTLLEFAQASEPREGATSNKNRGQLWEDLRSRVREEETSETAHEASEGSEKSGLSHRSAKQSPARSQVIAGPFLGWLRLRPTAILLGFCLLLSIWCVVLKLEVLRLSQPRVLEGMAELLSVENSRSRGDAEVELVSAGGSNLVVLNLLDSPLHSSYRLQISSTGRGAEPIWTSPEFRSLTRNGVILAVPPDFLKPGDYWIRLDGLDAGSETLVAEYSLRVD